MDKPITITITDDSGTELDSFTVIRLPFGADERDYAQFDFPTDNPLAVDVVTGSMVLDRIDQGLLGERESFKQWFGRMERIG